MMKQIILGETYKRIKYHGDVKFFIFECNQCHSTFEKPESYFSKQLKKRKNACCFCTAVCRARYFNSHRLGLSSPDLTPSPKPIDKENIFISFLKTILAER